jgi:hypothetical protein
VSSTWKARWNARENDGPGLSRWRDGRYRVVNPDIFGTADVVWVTEKGDSRDRLRKIMLEELQRRNYSAITTRNYLRVVADFAKHFGKSPDKLGLNELRTYQAYLLRERKLTPGTVVNQVAALRFFFVKTLKRQSDGNGVSVGALDDVRLMTGSPLRISDQSEDRVWRWFEKRGLRAAARQKIQQR